MVDANTAESESQAERVARMKSEFLVAQQRRREKLSKTTSPSGGADDGPPQPGPADETPARAVAVRP